MGRLCAMLGANCGSALRNVGANCGSALRNVGGKLWPGHCLV